MKPPKVLLLYEEDNTCEDLRALLCGEGCEVQEAPLTPETVAPAEGYCLVVFDVQRPASLPPIARTWRDTFADTMLVVIGNRVSQAQRVAVLESGVDAYLTKPLMIPELRARVRAATRRFRSQHERLRRFALGDGIVDLEARLFSGRGYNLRLTPTECGILEHLSAHMNQTVPANELVKTLWGSDPQKGVHSLRLFIRRLRQKLEPDPPHPRYLVTDPGVGYRLQTPEDSQGKSTPSRSRKQFA
jgi:two-component system KDP operon response regulator KdpE